MKLFHLSLSLAWASIVLASVQYKSTDDLPKDIRNLKLTGIVTSVYDGDTFRFYHLANNESNPGRLNYKDTLRIRLFGVDTPELAREGKPGQPLAAEARDLVQGLIEKQRVTLELFSRDQYNRVLGSVSAQGAPLSLTLVERGLAFVYRGIGSEYGQYGPQLFSAEKSAKKNKRGVWGLADNMTPAEYKRRYG